MSEKEILSKFGPTFQEKLVNIITNDRPFAEQIGEVIESDFFDLKYLQFFVKEFYKYREQYDKFPSKEIFASVLGLSLEDKPEVLKEQVIGFYNRIFDKHEVEDSEFIKKEALDFCKYQKMVDAILKSAELLKNSNYKDHDNIKGIIDKAMKLGLDSNFGYDYLLDFEKRFLTKLRVPLSTGWKEIDRICDGGFGIKELAVVIAPTGGGKSIILVHLGAEALKQGRNVIHYTFELSDTVIGNRYDACLSNVSMNHLKEFKQEIHDSIKDLDARLIIKEYPPKRATTQHIRNHLEKLIRGGIIPGTIIVDYADLISPGGHNQEKRHGLEEIYEDLRAIAMEYNVQVITASQTNRKGLNADVITMEEISEAFNKCFVADFIFTMSRTIEDRNKNSGRFYIAKNRNGKDGIVFPIEMNPEFMRVKVLPQGSKEELKNLLMSKKDDKSLQDVWKQFKGAPAPAQEAELKKEEGTEKNVES